MIGRSESDRINALETENWPPVSVLKRSPLYSEELGIDLKSGRDQEYFKWLLASLLFGARISETIAANTYRSFQRHGLLDPRAIIKAGWEYLVNPIMREGGYVRYDGQKSNHVLETCRALLTDYQGSLKRLHEQATDRTDLEARLLSFHGVGPVTANIFLRELRPFWKLANPDPLPVIRKVAQRANIDLDAFNRKTIGFIRIEAGLLRLRKRVRRF